MDRRGFFKSIIFTPLLAPFMLASQSAKSGFVLYIIADSPQMFLPRILQGLHRYGLISGYNFAFINFFPEELDLKRSLYKQGWKHAPKVAQADLLLSLNHLPQKALPSFTLIKNKRVWDIRTRELLYLWKEMNTLYPPSSWVTIASFKDRTARLSPGSFSSIYIGGRMVEMFPLNKNVFKSFRTNRGKITVSIENRKAWVFDSSCFHKICMSSSPASLAGERIICAPNHFLMEITGSSSIDTVIG